MTAALSIHNLTKTYGNGVQALRGISLDVEAGDFYALLGPNGAGKSTTIGVVSSLVKKSAGEVRIFGHDIDTDLSLAKQRLGVVPQVVAVAIVDRLQHEPDLDTLNFLLEHVRDSTSWRGRRAGAHRRRASRDSRSRPLPGSDRARSSWPSP